jgi:hypothetical protein
VFGRAHWRAAGDGGKPTDAAPLLRPDESAPPARRRGSRRRSARAHLDRGRQLSRRCEWLKAALIARSRTLLAKVH